MRSSIPDPPLASDERRDLVLGFLRSIGKPVKVWRICRYTGLGTAAVTVALTHLKPLVYRNEDGTWEAT